MGEEPCSARMTKSKARLANIDKLQEQMIDEERKGADHPDSGRAAAG